MSNLTSLYLSHNQIREIPDTVSNLSTLTLLYLSHNQIRKVSEIIFNLSSLTTLDLSSNHITQIPIEILNSRNIKDLFNYLDQLYMNGTRPLHEAKLLLIGQGSVGKTSLIERLINNHYDTN